MRSIKPPLAQGQLKKNLTRSVTNDFMAKRILLVDDERSIRESLSKILRAENYEVVLAETSQEAIEKHGAERIDLLILDLTPVKNWASLEWLVAIHPLAPVVIITGRSNQGALAQTAGADALMEKPLDVPLLLQTIRQLMDKSMEKEPADLSRFEGEGGLEAPEPATARPEQQGLFAEFEAT
jgi:DNA-binding response OmpR family regulator